MQFNQRKTTSPGRVTMITGKAVIGPKKMVVMAKDVSVITDPNISFGATLAGSRSSLAESARHYPLVL